PATASPNVCAFRGRSRGNSSENRSRIPFLPSLLHPGRYRSATMLRLLPRRTAPPQECRNAVASFAPILPYEKKWYLVHPVPGFHLHEIRTIGHTELRGKNYGRLRSLCYRVLGVGHP